MPRGNGGIIGPVNTSFSGVWSLTEAQLRRSGGTWPNFYASSLSESATGSDVFSAADNADPYFEYTTLLLPGNGTNGAQNNTFLDGSTNNFTITRNGNTTQGTFSPFSQTGWGNYFGGSPAYLSGSSQILGVGGNNFTVEAWVFIPTLSGIPNYVILGTSTTSNSPTGIYFAVKPDGNLIAAETWGTNVYTTTGLTFTAGTWNHVALCRSGSTVRIFLNGVAASNTGSFSASYNSTLFAIGRTWTTDAANSSYMIGTISNLRVISNQALYSGTFTPSTSPLTSTTVGSTGAGAAGSITGTVTLLTCQDNRFKDNSTTPKTLTVTGSPLVQAFSPFNPTASWSAATNGGSGYFDGSGDYLTAGAASNWTFLHNGSDWTAQFWVYHDATSSYSIISTTAFSAQIGMSIILNNSGANTVQVYITRGVSGSDANFVSSAALVVNQWNYVAVTFTSSTKTCAFTINGASAGSSSNTGFAYSSSDPTNTLAIGRYQGSSPSAYLNGYISSLRISNTIRTGLTTLPTTPYTSDANTNLLLNFTNAGIYDATSKNDLETVGNAQISTTQSKWGGSSIYVDGTGDYLMAKSQPFLNPGSSNFTIEAWVNFSAAVSSTLYLIVAKTTSGTNTSSFSFSRNTANKLAFAFWSDGTGGNYVIISTTANFPSSTGVWNHVAVTRSGSTFYLFIDGVSQTITTSLNGTATLSSPIFASETPITVGASADPNYFLNGYVQDVRITNYARYTANFTAPTAAFPTL